MADTLQRRETPLSIELQRAQPTRAAKPRDAFNLAAQKWMNGERIEMNALAMELGVGRATLFRWVGSRELLLGEVIWALFDATWTHAMSQARGSGACYAADATHRLMDLVLQSTALRMFIAQDPEYALRILTSKSSTVQSRIVARLCRILEEMAAEGTIRPALGIEALAFVMVRIVESCLYSDQIAGRNPDIDAATEAIRILVAATPAAIA